MRLILVRHGETDSNAGGVYQGWLDVPLNETGERQAAAVATALAARDDIRPVAVYASPLRRAWRTAEAIGTALGLAPVAHPGLREIHVGAAQGLPFEEIARRWPDLAADRERRGLDHGWPEGETGWAFRARVIAALDEIVARRRGAGPEDAAIVVAHGGTIRHALAHLRGDAPGPWPTDPIANCSLTEVQLDGAAGAGHRVVLTNGCAHLGEWRREPRLPWRQAGTRSAAE